MVHIPLVSNNNGQLNCYMLLINDPSLAIQWSVGQVNWNMFSPLRTISMHFSVLWAGLCHCRSVVADFCHFWGQMIGFFTFSDIMSPHSLVSISHPKSFHYFHLHNFNSDMTFTFTFTFSPDMSIPIMPVCV